MNQVISRVQRFLTSEEGPTAVEYAVMMGLIVVAIVGIVGKLAQQHQRHVQHGQQHARLIVIGPQRQAALSTTGCLRNPGLVTRTFELSAGELKCTRFAISRFDDSLRAKTARRPSSTRCWSG